MSEHSEPVNITLHDGNGNKKIITLREPTVAERNYANKERDAAFFKKGKAGSNMLGYMLQVLAIISKLDVDSPYFKNLTDEDIQEIQYFLRNMGDDEPLPKVIEVTVKFPPFNGVDGKVYSEMILRRPSILEIDRVLMLAQKPDNSIDMTKATNLFLVSHSNLPEHALNQLPCSVYDKAVMFYVSFLDDLMMPPKRVRQSIVSSESVEA